MSKVVVFLFIGIISLGVIKNSSDSDITGKWQSTGHSKEVLTFSKDGRILEIPDSKYEVVTSVEPNQLYMVAKDSDGTLKRIPLGIFKVSGNKLTIAYAKYFDRVMAGMSLGLSRIEIPKDFSGVELQEFKRVN